MKEKTKAKMPRTFAEYIGTFASREVRILLSSGDHREGVLVVHEDFVTLEEQYGAYATAHIAAIEPLHLTAADIPPPRHADVHAREHAKRQ